MSAVKALQDVELARFWEEFASVMGAEDGLMTYRYLGTSATALNPKKAEGRLRLRSDLPTEHGLQAAPLGILVADVVGILADAISVPAPTQIDITILDDGVGVEEVHCTSQLLHAGRTMLFGKSVLVDADAPDRVLAVCRDSAAVMAVAPEGYQSLPPGAGVADSGNLPPLWQAFGARHRTRGGFELPSLTSRLGSTSGSLHHGPTQVILEATAFEKAAGACGDDRLRLTNWHVSFIARGKTGPFISNARVASVADEHVAIDVELHETAACRMIASGTAVFARLS